MRMPQVGLGPRSLRMGDPPSPAQQTPEGGNLGLRAACPTCQPLCSPQWMGGGEESEKEALPPGVFRLFIQKHFSVLPASVLQGEGAWRAGRWDWGRAPGREGWDRGGGGGGGTGWGREGGRKGWDGEGAGQGRCPATPLLPVRRPCGYPEYSEAPLHRLLAALWPWLFKARALTVPPTPTQAWRLGSDGAGHALVPPPAPKGPQLPPCRPAEVAAPPGLDAPLLHAVAEDGPHRGALGGAHGHPPGAGLRGGGWTPSPGECLPAVPTSPHTHRKQSRNARLVLPPDREALVCRLEPVAAFGPLTWPRGTSWSWAAWGPAEAPGRTVPTQTQTEAQAFVLVGG